MTRDGLYVHLHIPYVDRIRDEEILKSVDELLNHHIPTIMNVNQLKELNKKTDIKSAFFSESQKVFTLRRHSLLLLDDPLAQHKPLERYHQHVNHTLGYGCIHQDGSRSEDLTH